MDSNRNPRQRSAVKARGRRSRKAKDVMGDIYTEDDHEKKAGLAVGI